MTEQTSLVPVQLLLFTYKYVFLCTKAKPLRRKIVKLFFYAGCVIMQNNLFIICYPKLLETKLTSRDALRYKWQLKEDDVK